MSGKVKFHKTLGWLVVAALVAKEVISISVGLPGTPFWGFFDLVFLVVLAMLLLLRPFVETGDEDDQEGTDTVQAGSFRSRLLAIEQSNAIIEFDVEGIILYVNEAFCSLLGYSAVELIGKGRSVFFKEGRKETVEDTAFWGQLTAGQRLKGEFERVRKDGKTIWIQETYDPIIDQQGRVSRIVKMATDVTARVEQQQELEAQRKQFSELLNFVDHSTIVSRADSKGKITYVNKKFTEVSGYSLEEVIGKDHNVVNSGLHPPEMWKDMYKTVIKDKAIWNRIVTNRSKNGSLYHVDTYIKAEFNTITGALEGYASLRQDLTALKKNEQESRSRMNAINKSNAVIEFQVDGKIIQANDAFCELFGYSQEALLGRYHDIFVSEEQARSEAYQAFWQDLSKGKFVQSEFERIKKDGSVVWLQASYNPVMDTEGKIIRIMKIATDITQRVKQEEEIIKKNTYLEHAARILRHDMHSGINTYIPRGVSSLRRRIPEEKLAELKIEASIRMIEGGLKHTQKVYQGVYEFTNLVKKDASLKRVELNLSAILNEFLEGAAYRGDVQISELPNAMVSEQLFCTAVDNLIRNGLRYNDSLTKWVRIFMIDEYHLGIQDNGRGISQAEFDLFSKNSMRRENQKESGSGLGLGICVAILKEHNFALSVEPGAPTGTLIKIKIN